MLTPNHMRAMRTELAKIASQSVRGPVPPQHENLSRARLKQTMKDLPLVVGGSALGYGVGRTLGEVAARSFIKSESGRAQARKYAPMAGAVLSSVGSYGLGVQRAIMKERRDKAEELDAHAKLKRSSPYIATASPKFARMADRATRAHDPGQREQGKEPGDLVLR